jgi:hypothetical protein
MDEAAAIALSIIKFLLDKINRVDRAVNKRQIIGLAECE